VTVPVAMAGLPQVLAVEDLPAALWERWPPRSPLRSRRWLQACRVPGDQALCVRTEVGDGLVAGRLVDRPDAWARLNAVDICAGLLFGVAADAAEVEAARRLAVPHLLVAFPGYDTGLVGAPTAADAVVAAVASTASAAGALPAYAYLPPDEPLLAALRRAGYVTGLVAATARLDLAEPSFPAYLASLPGKRRREIRREVRRFEGAGASIEVLPAPAAAGVLAEVAALEASVSGRHGRQEAPSAPAAVNARLAAAFREDMLVVVARHGARCLASATMFRHGDELHVRSAGIDYEAARPLFAHFVVAYVTPVRVACDLGLRRVGFGIAAFGAKVARGARLVPLAAALPAHAPLSLLRLLERTDRCLRRSLPWKDTPAP
jgi:Acetyltransferase (GNAT) domain